MDAAEIARLFDLGGAARLSAGPVARGKMGHVWRLETTDGRWAVKLPLHPATEAEVGPATRFQEAAHAAGVPTPLVRRTVDGTVLASVGGRQVRVYEWVDLLDPDPLLDPALVGAVIATMHQVPVDGPGEVHPWYREPVGAAGWDAIMQDLRAASAPFAERLGALRDELVALETWIEPEATLRFCHRDLWSDNLLPTRDGGVCVIDWDNSGAADPSHELACALFEFGRTDPGRARALASAYRAAGGPGRVRRRGHFSMLIGQLGHITEAGARDWLHPNPRSPTRAAAAAWIGEVLDEPHTRQVLDTLLAAARPDTAAAGSVRVWHAEEGWGVIDSPATPGGCWTHYSQIAGPEQHLRTGLAVELEWESARQDGYAYRAVRVWPSDGNADLTAG